MRTLLSGIAVAAIIATGPALASGFTAQGQDQDQSQTQAQIAAAKAAAEANAAAINQTKQLNEQQLSSDDDTKTEVYAVSYTDTQPLAPQAAIGSGVVVTTWGVKVLGPVFGMTDQHVHYLPAALNEAASFAAKATTNDGTVAGEQKQFAYVAAVCAHDEALAEQLNFGCK